MLGIATAAEEPVRILHVCYEMCSAAEAYTPLVCGFALLNAPMGILKEHNDKSKPIQKSFPGAKRKTAAKR